jgi:FkbM family methyltransferase
MYVGEVKAELERQSRAAAAVVPVTERVNLCRVLGKYKLYVPSIDTSIAPCLMLDGIWESWIVVALTGMVRRGMYTVNVGANVGYYTMLLADLAGPEGKVMAFEPQPRLAALIEFSAHANGFYGDRVTVQPFAVGDKALTRVELLSSPLRNGYAFVRDELEAKHVVQKNETRGVKQVTLDDEIARPVDFLLMDCEGSEERVWDGMQGVLDRSPKMQMVLEFTPMFLKDPLGFARKLTSRGHHLFEITAYGELVSISEEKLCGAYQTNVALLK